MIDNLPYKEILLLVLGTLSTYLIWRVQYQKEKIKNIENQLSESKFKVYSELVHIIFDVIAGDKAGKKISNQDLVKRILEIKKNMFLYASDEMFLAFTSWSLELQKPGNNGVDHFKKYFELIKLVRKDMGNRNTQINLDDFMIYLMQNKEEYLSFKQQHNWI
ncbi:hypothetical protein [Chryseobacterium indologenes]|uniref:hypothetical protein n=1 Tax=Chryseobacterium indologenes TaxID=253 RepID=UPI0009A13FE2|nr:hypothetical protein [Chryseobacterium indologenes]